MSFIYNISAVSLLLFFSAFLGFFREFLIAKTFGVNNESDVFLLAYSGVSYIFLVFNPLTIKTLFMPIYQQFLIENKFQQAKTIFFNSLKYLVAILLVLWLILILNLPMISSILAPGLTESQTRLSITLLLILSPLILFYGLASLCHAICNAHKNFIAPLICQVINNGLLILGICLINEITILQLGLLFVGSGLFYFVIMIYFSIPYITKNFVNKTNENNKLYIKNKISLKLFYHALPLFVLVMGEQVSLMIQKSITSTLEVGGVSALHYAFKLTNVPITIFAFGISTVLFPLFIELGHRKSSNNPDLLKLSIKYLVIILFFISIFYIIFSREISCLLFYKANITEIGIDKTASAVYYYALGIIPQGLLILLNRLYWANQNGKDFVKITLGCMAIQILLSYVLAKQYGHNGVALATSLSAYLNVFLLFLNSHALNTFKVMRMSKLCGAEY